MNFKNRTLYHLDNLLVLRGMNSESVDLIATDPPFNKGKDFHATPDSLTSGAAFHDRWSWQNDVHYDWLGDIEKENPSVWSAIMLAKTSYGNDMGAFLCYMAVRLMEMRRVLKENGSIYLHCDPTASHYLKAVMDAIFGRENFRNEITWQRYGSHNDAAKNYSNVSDSILFYAPPEAVWNTQRTQLDEETIDKYYTKTDERGRFTTSPLHARTLSGGGYKYTWRGITDTWKFPEHRLEELDADNRIYWPPKGKVPRRKVYLSDVEGKPRTNNVTDIPIAAGNERTGYPTQKPVALYELFISASSNEEDMVLDPFCGCATTPIAAEKLGRQWVGIDIWDGAYREVVRRMKDEAWRGVTGESQMGMGLYPIHYETTPPIRTDGGEEAAPFMLSLTGRQKKKHPPIREQKVKLLEELGSICQGCGREYEDKRILEVDHKMPKSDGGSDAYDNLTLLCPPCYKVKRDQLTLSGLQGKNKHEGHMHDESRIKVGASKRRVRRRRR